MPAPLGNKHAEKWTRERTILHLERIEKNVKQYDLLFLGDALLQVGLYNDIWSYWKEKWQDDEDIYDRMMMIMQRFENRIFKAALFKEVQASVAIFTLKCQHGWAIPKAEKEKPAPAAPANVAPAAEVQAPIVEKEVIQEETPATPPSVKVETPARVIQPIEGVKDVATMNPTDIRHHEVVPLADTGS